jgi:hypothetical protein
MYTWKKILSVAMIDGAATDDPANVGFGLDEEITADGAAYGGIDPVGGFGCFGTGGLASAGGHGHVS